MPHVFNLNFPEYKFVLLSLHTMLDNFGEQKQHKVNKWGMPSE